MQYEIGENKRKDTNDQQEFRGDQTVLIKGKAEVTNPRTGELATARFLGAEAPTVTQAQDELQALADWLVRKSMFASHAGQSRVVQSARTRPRRSCG